MAFTEVRQRGNFSLSRQRPPVSARILYRAHRLFHAPATAFMNHNETLFERVARPRADAGREDRGVPPRRGDESSGYPPHRGAGEIRHPDRPRAARAGDGFIDGRCGGGRSPNTPPLSSATRRLTSGRPRHGPFWLFVPCWSRIYQHRPSPALVRTRAFSISKPCFRTQKRGLRLPLHWPVRTHLTLCGWAPGELEAGSFGPFYVLSRGNRLSSRRARGATSRGLCLVRAAPLGGCWFSEYGTWLRPWK